MYSRYCFQENKGFDGSGRHCGCNDHIVNYFAPIYPKNNLQIDCTPLKPNRIILSRFRNYHNNYISFIRETTIINRMLKKINKIKLYFNNIKKD